MDVFSMIAEQKIQEAIQKGEMDNLPGQGKPLVLENWSSVPEDLRLAYKILKNSGHLPEEMQLHKEMVIPGRIDRTLPGFIGTPRTSETLECQTASFANANGAAGRNNFAYMEQVSFQDREPVEREKNR